MTVLFLLLNLSIIFFCFYLLAMICNEYFVGSLDIISKKLKISGDVAGATFMAVGSSAPELFTSIMALVIPGDHGQIGAGTIVGSAIFNILVIIGASSIATTVILCWQPVLRDSIFYIISILLLLFTFRDGQITSFEALMFVVLYVIYIIAVVYWRKILPYKEEDHVLEVIENESLCNRKLSFIDKLFAAVIANPCTEPEKYWRIFISSIFFIGLLSYILVETAVITAHILNINDSIIALTVLAAGTSIPDLMSSVIVARKGKGGMAVSNAIGSNIFDILFGLGMPWLLYTWFKGDVMVSTKNLFSSIILLLTTVFVVFFLMLINRWKLPRKAGIFLIFFYLLYLGYIIWITVFPDQIPDPEMLKSYLLG